MLASGGGAGRAGVVAAGSVLAVRRRRVPADRAAAEDPALVRRGLLRVEQRRKGCPRSRLWRPVLRCAGFRAMAVAAVNGIEISYADSGGAGPAVVFSHGYLMDQAMSGRRVAAFAREYRVITWDQRGHGGTSAIGAFTSWDSAAGLLGLLGQLGAGRALLAGLSLGGLLSLRAALSAPDRVRALVLIDSQAGREDPASAPAYESGCTRPGWTTDRGRCRRSSPGSSWVRAGGTAGPPRGTSSTGSGPPDDLGQLTWPFRCLMDRDDLTGRLAEITCPTLIVHGTADASIPVARAEAVRDGLGGPVTFVVVEGAAHASNLTHPDQVNRAVLGFLNGLDGG